MASEVIREMSYDARADIWSLGITLIELAEGNPPHHNVHPMRAIFMIPVKPAPRLTDPSRWSREMDDFLCRCLVKEVDDRGTSEELVDHPWIATEVKKIKKRGANPGLSILSKLVSDNYEAIVRFRNAENQQEEEGIPDIGTLDDSEGDKTLKKHTSGRGGGTLNNSRGRDSDASTLRQLARKASLRKTPESTIFFDGGTMKRVDSTVPEGTGTLVRSSGTVVTSSPEQQVDSSTMRRFSNADGTMQRVGASKEELVLSELRNALKYFQRDAPERSNGAQRSAIVDALPPPQFSDPQIPKPPEQANSRKVEMEAFLSRITDTESQKLDINDASATAIQVCF